MGEIGEIGPEVGAGEGINGNDNDNDDDNDQNRAGAKGAKGAKGTAEPAGACSLQTLRHCTRCGSLFRAERVQLRAQPVVMRRQHCHRK